MPLARILCVAAVVAAAAAPAQARPRERLFTLLDSESASLLTPAAVGRPAGLFRPGAVLALTGLRDGGYALVTGRGVFRVGLDGRVAQGVAVAASGVAELPDGALVYRTARKVRRLGRDGAVRTLAVFEEAGEIAAGADGSVYVGDGSVVRRIDPSGEVSTVAGSEDRRKPATGMLATGAGFDAIARLAVTSDGALLISDGSHIWRLGRDGRLRNLGGGAHLTPGSASRRTPCRRCRTAASSPRATAASRSWSARTGA
jgi:hypothetical protein